MVYNIKYCRAIQVHCALGNSINSFAGSIEASIADLAHWVATEPSFNKAVQVAASKQLLFWEQQLATDLANQSANRTQSLAMVNNIQSELNSILELSKSFNKVGISKDKIIGALMLLRFIRDGGELFNDLTDKQIELMANGIYNTVNIMG